MFAFLISAAGTGAALLTREASIYNLQLHSVVCIADSGPVTDAPHHLSRELDGPHDSPGDAGQLAVGLHE